MRSSITEKWLSDAFSTARPSQRIRRCFSECSIYYCYNQEIINDPPIRKGRDWYNKNTNLLNIDKKFEIPILKEHYLYKLFCKQLTNQLLKFNRFSSPKTRNFGVVEVSRILFSTVDGIIYAIDSEHDEKNALCSFSHNFGDYFRRFEIWNRKIGEDWQRKVVVLFLEEFVDDGTEFRRALHIGTYNRVGVFFELDTGNIRTLENPNLSNVMLLPVEFQNQPSAIFEMRFKNCEARRVGEMIEKVRETGRVCVIGFDYIDRNRRQHLHPNNIMTLVVLPAPRPPPSPINRLFCGERDCMGMCAMINTPTPLKLEKGMRECTNAQRISTQKI